MTKILLATTMLAGLLAACDDSTDPLEPAPVASLEVTAPATALDPGTTLQLTATPLDEEGEELEGRKINWASSDLGVAIVSATGLVTARTAGPVVITATAEGVAGEASLTVREVAPAVAWVDIGPAGEIDLTPGATAQLYAIPRAGDGGELVGRVVTWESYDTTVATVSATGLVSGIAEGTTWITATCEDQIAQVLLTVTAIEEPVAWVEITAGAAIALTPGGSQQLEVIAHAADGDVLVGRTVTWTTDATSVATVSATGLVEALAEGTAAITAEVESQTAAIEVTVEGPPVASIELSHEEAVIVVDDTLQLWAQPYDQLGVPLDRPVTWASEHPGVASVDANGVVTGLGEGTTEITATSGGESASLIVYVTTWRVQQLASIDGAPMPATLFTYTETVGGVERTVSFDAFEGQFRWHGIDPRFELWIWGWMETEGFPGVVSGYFVEGSWEYVGGAYLFHPDAGQSFSGTVAPGWSLSVVWQADPHAPAATLGFAPPE